MIIDVGPHSELNVFEMPDNPEAERQTPMFGRGRLDHLALQAEDIAAFEEIRRRLIARGAADEFVTDFGKVLSIFFRDPDGLEGEVCVDESRLGAGHVPSARARRARGTPRLSRDAPVGRPTLPRPISSTASHYLANLCNRLIRAEGAHMGRRTGFFGALTAVVAVVATAVGGSRGPPAP